MAEELTLQQRQAVENRGGRLLVSAAAGSGKTKVLVDRLMGYLSDPADPANIDEFLLITYTKAAAAELRGKIASKLGERVSQDPQNSHLRRQLQRLYLTPISTVHAFCADILREYAYRLNIPGDFRVADENECNEIRIRVMEKLLNDAYGQKMDDPYFWAFVDSQGLGRDDRQVPQIVMQVYDSARCHLDPDAWLRKCEDLVSGENVEDAGQTIYGAFLMEGLRNWLDFQIEAFNQCVQQATAVDGFEKPVTLLADTIRQLTFLRQSATWEEVLQRSHVDFGYLTFKKNCADELLRDRIKAVRDACKKGLEKKLQPFSDDSKQILQDLQESYDAVRGLVSLVHEFAVAYEMAKRSKRIMDFSDLEHHMLDLLLGKSRSHITVFANEIGQRFREVMVDEYQDSNEVQDAIYTALTNRRNNLFMVGDVKQSIYQFRLADPGIFLDKYQTFKPAVEAGIGEDRKVVLSRNFRSSGGVLEACNDVFETCMCPRVGGMYYGPEEALNEGFTHIPLDVPETELCCVDVQTHTYPEEAAFVASHIQNLLRCGMVRDGGQLRAVRPEDIVILLRSPGSTGVYFQKALDNLGIRYATGGGVDLLKTEEIGTLHAILKVIHNPRLDIPLIAALSSPAFGFTADDLASIRSKLKVGAFYDAMLRDDGFKTKEFLQTLQQLRGLVRYFSLTMLLEKVLLATSLEEIYGAMENGQIRLKNIQAFFQLASDFEAGGHRDLGRFLEHLETMEEKGLISAGEQSSKGRVTIMSIHKSKGLEFPVVYLCCLGREFNSESQRATVLCHKTMGLGLSVADKENRLRYPSVAKRAISSKIRMDMVSEELRVLYVAMTRAKDRLIMTYASRNLEADISDVVHRVDMGCKALLVEEAVCPGDWVLLTALQKTEAGALFALGGKPAETATGMQPWKIRVVTAEQPVVDSVEQESATVAEMIPLERLQKGLSFRYPYAAAMTIPSKQTATGIKGRVKDEEAAEFAGKKYRPQRTWRQPSVATKTKGTDYGNAMHKLMQHINFSCCTSVTAVEAEVQRLVRENFLQQDHAGLIDAKAIANFFASELGAKLMSGDVVREFKFSILWDPSQENEALSGEKVLMQGVVDCALIETDGITVIDFKTDSVKEESLEQKKQYYMPQIETYVQAMERIYERPVKKKILYFFSIHRALEV